MKINNMTKISLAGVLIIIALWSAGCGGASSAPPVDLPAPITGRIDASAPDEEGNVTISGSEGAVVGGMTVVAVNENVASAMSLGFLSKLVPSAYAVEKAFPMICSELGHACTVAASDGSFVLVIAAKEGDSILLGLIDPESGAFISETITITVPSSGAPEPTANCSGKGVSGAAVDIKIAPSTDTPILLKQGSATTTNQLVIGSSSPTTVPISGCYAHSLAIFKSSTGDVLAATSKDDKVLWTGRLASGAVAGARRFNLSKEPMHLIFVNSMTQVLVALKTPDTVELDAISLGTGDILATMVPQDSNVNIAGLTRSLRLDVKAMDSTYANNYIGLLLTDKGNNVDAYVTIFQPVTLTHKVTWSRSQINDVNKIPAEAFVDAAIFSTMIKGGLMNFAMLDSGLSKNALRLYLLRETPNTPLNYNTDFSAVSTLFFPEHSSEFACGASSMKHVRIYELNTVKGMIVDANGDLCKKMNMSGPDLILPLPWLSGHDVPSIAINDAASVMFGADATAGLAIDGSALLP